MKNTINIKKLTATAAIAGTALLLGPTAIAGTSSAAELRGFSQCVDEATQEQNRLITSRNYLIKNTANSRQFFINGTAWVDGERTPLRISCTTNKSGRVLLTHQVNTGRYVSSDSNSGDRVAERYPKRDCNCGDGVQLTPIVAVAR